MATINEQAVTNWYRAYTTKGVDQHGLFAKLTGLPRQEAKVLCYQIIFSIDILVPILQKEYDETTNTR